jgi:formate hydrogenlyase transcriptional activator
MEIPFPADQDALIHQLRERIKELDCLYSISDIAGNPSATLDSILQDIADAIPAGFQRPASTCVRIEVGERTAQTANFTTCEWTLEHDITQADAATGRLTVGHLDAPPPGEPIFLEEERKLVREIADRIGKVVRHRILADTLARSEREFRSLADSAPVGIFRTILGGDLLYANDAGLRMFGHESLEEARSLGSPLTLYRNPEDRKALVSALQATGKVCRVEAECLKKTGEPIFVLFSVVLEAGVLTGMAMDLTEQRRAHDTLVESERRLNEAQRIAKLGYWEWDIITGAVRSSDEFARILGFPLQELSGTYEEFFDLVHPDDRPAVQETLNRALSQPDAGYSIEHRMVRRDGSVCVVSGRGEVGLDATGRPVRMFGTAHDITAPKQAEAELRQALEEIKVLKDQLESENVSLRNEMDLKDGYRDIVGTSDPIRYALHRTRQVARSKTTVLLTGETGTGKGVFARFLHRESDRRDQVFVSVNCASLPANLIESELFGREKGAFTGSTARQIGRFELANHGTIFLDEVGELPIELQAKLLRVIEDGVFERLGSPHPVNVDVRIVASTNRNLEEEVAHGRFRRDLFYRLNVFPITIPPLRQRREDIPLLVRNFVARFNQSHGKRASRIPPTLMSSLTAYPWPGNVRELMNVLERSVIVSDGPELQLAGDIGASAMSAAGNTATREPNSRQAHDLAEVERTHICQLLRETGWRIEGPKGAARLLGLNPSTLRTRMKKLGIRRPGA